MLALVHLVGGQVDVSVLLFGWVSLLAVSLADSVARVLDEPSVPRNSAFVVLIKSRVLVLVRLDVGNHLLVLRQLWLESCVASHLVFAEFNRRIRV